MEHFSYSLSLTLIHSLWQSALLFCLYLGFTAAASNISPVAKRNILFSLLLSQLALSVSTFYIFYSNTESYYQELLNTTLREVFDGTLFFDKMAPWIMSTYAIVLLYKFTGLLTNWFRFKNIGSDCRIKPSTDIRLFTKVKAYHFGIRRKVNIWYSSNITSPMTFGFFKPIILLPVALVNHLSVQDTESLIIHELTHIKNNDYFLNWILLTIETIFFFNPFIIVMGKRIRLEREKNCDSHVLQFNYPAISYAETLLKAATLKRVPVPFFLGAAFKNVQLLSRIRFFTIEKNLAFKKRSYSGITILLAVMLFFINLFFISAVNTENNSGIENINKKISGDFLNRVNGLKNDPITAQVVFPEAKPSIRNPVIRINVPGVQQVLSLTKVPTAEPFNESQVQEYEPETQQYAFPASIYDGETVKEITVKDENSLTGEIVTRVFQVKFINGLWETRLLLAVTESKPIYDSGQVKKDSIIFINPVQ